MTPRILKKNACKCGQFIRKIYPLYYRGVQVEIIEVCGNCGWFPPPKKKINQKLAAASSIKAESSLPF